MAVKKADIKTAAVAEANKTTKINVTDKTATRIKATAPAAQKTAPSKVAVKEAEKGAAAKTAAKKPTKKDTRKPAANNKTELYIQFAGKDIATDELIKRVHEIWTGELGNKISTIKNLKLYMKPEEHTAYYVINDDVSGKIDM